MKKLIITFISLGLLTVNTSSALANEATVKTLMKSYQSQGAKVGDAQRGEKFWNQTFQGKAPFSQRSCKSCHTANLKNKGEHVRTGKVLKPLAPSINNLSLSKENKVNKWFKRNCKWTTGKECSAQVKADVLAFIDLQ